MMLENDQLPIRDALLRGEISWEEALASITSRRGKPWHTAAWKQKRASLVGNKCDQCGSVSAPFVLQHLWQPRRYKDIYEAIYVDTFRSEYESWSTKLNNITDKYPPIDRPTCPKCNSTAIRKLAGGDWVCNSTANSPTKWPSTLIRCGFRFSEPTVAKAHSPDQKREISAEKRTHYEKFRSDFRKNFHDKISTQAVLLSIEEHGRYISFVDTKTFCKKCAFMWDMRDCKLCEKCRKRFHSRHMSCCAACDPEHFKLCAKCNQQYHPVRFKVCLACHIGKPGVHSREEELSAILPPNDL